MYPLVIYTFEAYHTLMACRYLVTKERIDALAELGFTDYVYCNVSNLKGKCPKAKIKDIITPHCWRLK